MVLFAKVVHSTLALLPFFVFIEKRLGQHWRKIEKRSEVEMLQIYDFPKKRAEKNE